MRVLAREIVRRADASVHGMRDPGAPRFFELACDGGVAGMARVRASIHRASRAVDFCFLFGNQENSIFATRRYARKWRCLMEKESIARPMANPSQTLELGAILRQPQSSRWRRTVHPATAEPGAALAIDVFQFQASASCKSAWCAAIPADWPLHPAPRSPS